MGRYLEFTHYVITRLFLPIYVIKDLFYVLLDFTNARKKLINTTRRMRAFRHSFINKDDVLLIICISLSNLFFNLNGKCRYIFCTFFRAFSELTHLFSYNSKTLSMFTSTRCLN